MAVIMLVAAYAVMGAPQGANVTTGTQETGTGTSSQTFTTEGGNVTEANITGIQITSRWSGFWGSIAASLRLSDAASNLFYEWTVTNVTDAVVYAVNDSSAPTWANLGPLPETVLPATFRSANAVDNFNGTFTATEAFTSASLTVANTPYTETWQAGSQGSLKTYALNESTTVVFAGKAIENTSSFKGATPKVDYQILAPAYTGSNNEDIWYFYLELP
jgi:hypothetical protein